MLTIFSLLALVVATPDAAEIAPAPTVSAGCSQPGAAPNHVWVIDPVDGDDVNGGGSASAPWKTVGSVFGSGAWGGPRLNVYPYRHRDPAGAWVAAPDAAGPVSPGDAVELMSGTYGALDVGVYDAPTALSAWLTFFPAPGATPTFSQIRVEQAINRLRFSGLTLRPDGVAAGPFVYVLGGTDIVFDKLDMANVEDAARTSYTAAQWNANVTRQGAAIDGRAGGSCLTLANGHIHNVTGGVGITNGANVAVENNEIDHFIDDGIDLGGNHIAIVGNNIHDDIVTTDNHMDAIQGFGSPLNAKFTDLLIDKNVIHRQLDPNNPFAAYLQGIDSWDNDWTDVRITRNVVMTASCWGITWGTSHYALFAHNTVVWDGASPGVACGPGFVPFEATHEFPVGDHIVAINNIAYGADGTVDAAAAPPTGSVLTANLVTNDITYWDPVANAVARPTTAGTYAGNRLLATDPPNGVFHALERTGSAGRSETAQSTSNPGYHLRLAAGSPAVGLGVTTTPELAALTAAYPNLALPATDFIGVSYSTTAPAAGAYAYASSSISVTPPSR